MVVFPVKADRRLAWISKKKLSKGGRGPRTSASLELQLESYKKCCLCVGEKNAYRRLRREMSQKKGRCPS